MNPRSLYTPLVFVLFAIGSNCYGSSAASSGLVVKINSTPSACQHSIVKIAEHSGNPFSKAGKEDGSIMIATSDAVPHASVTTISPLTFAVVISLINNDECDQELSVTAPAKLTLFRKILFGVIISPNAP